VIPEADVGPSSFYGVAANSLGDAWAVGLAGAYTSNTLIEHWDGQNWTQVSSPNVPKPGSNNALSDAAVVPGGGGVWAVGTAYYGGGLIEEACPVQLLDSGFTPDSSAVGQASTVEWSLPSTNSMSHDVTDGSGMGLFASGPRTPGSSFTFTLNAAGVYPVIDSVTGHTSTVRVPVTVWPRTGPRSNRFTIRWARGSVPAGYVFDVQIRRPGTKRFVKWKYGTSALFAYFTPDHGAGEYAFRARLRNAVNGKASLYSWATRIFVS
jgi:plastocyanin